MVSRPNPRDFQLLGYKIVRSVHPMKLAPPRIAGRFYVAGVLAIHLLVVWSARELILKGYPDFTIYYTAGTIVRQGMGHRLYDDRVQFAVQKQFAPQVATRLGALPFNHPPFEALLYVPLTWLSYRAAYLWWTLANLGMLAALPILLRPYVPWMTMTAWSAPAWAGVSLAFFPIFFALLQGQDAILLMFLYGLTFVSLKRERLFGAGAWLACGLFKFHLVLPFLVLLLIQQKALQRSKKILFGFSLVGALLAAVSIATVGLGQMIAYPRYVLGLEATMARGAIMPSDMPNLRGALYLLASSMRFFDVLVVALSAILFLVAAWNSRSRNGSAADLQFATAVFATVLVSYHALGYDLCVLALPALLLAGELKDRKVSGTWTRSAITAGLVILLFSPLQLVLLMRYNHLALLGWAVLLCFIGLSGELRMRTGISA
jgi:Glycosyltransferase family 87